MWGEKSGKILNGECLAFKRDFCNFAVEYGLNF